MLGACFLCEWISLWLGITESPIRAEIPLISLRRSDGETPRITLDSEPKAKPSAQEGILERGALITYYCLKHRTYLKLVWSLCCMLSLLGAWRVDSNIASWDYFCCVEAWCWRVLWTTTSLRQQRLMRRCMSEHAHLGTDSIHVACSAHT